MKETGLMFKAPLVRAILSGQKTQTRRVVTPQPHDDRLHQSVDQPTRGSSGEWTWWAGNHTQGIYHSAKCPFGKRGDRIYVRETFVQGYEEDPLTGRLKQWDEEGNDIPMTTWYRATNGGITWSDDGESEANVPWKPAIHMPKSLARIWLEVTGVRVERLLEISEADAETEGIGFLREVPDADETLTAKQLFECLWETTGGDWAANPWVWVIDFKRLTSSNL